MPRKKKNVLNQKVEEVKIEKEEVIEEPKAEPAKLLAPEIEPVQPITEPVEEVPEEIETFYNTDIVDELEKAVEEELEETIVEPAPEEGQAIVFTNEPIEIDLMKKPEPRRMSVKEQKRFLRTGRMPF